MSTFDDMVNSTLFGDDDQAAGPFDAMRKAGTSFADFAFGRDPRFEQTGVQAFGFRAGLSAADTPEEREAYLNRQVGPGGWTTDKYGNYALTPQGKQVVGMDPGEMPTLIDAPLTAKGIELGDIADIRGDVPAIAGGVAGALAATGAGAPLGIAAAAGGAGLGKMIDEMTEAAMGQQMQTPGEVATDVAGEMALAGGGEVLYRGVLGPLGRKLMAPHAKRITPQAADMAKGAEDLGVPLKPTSVTRAPLLSTIERISTSVLREDPVLDAGRKAVKKNVDRLVARYGKEGVSKEMLGELVASDMRTSRRALSAQATRWFDRVDQLAEGKPIISTARLKQAAADVVEDFPKGAEGQPLFTQGEGMKGVFAAVNDINALPDNVTVVDMWKSEQIIRDLGDIYNLAPGKGAHYSGMLGNAISESYNDAVKSGKGAAVKALKNARRNYAERIQDFTNQTVRRVVRDPSLMGSLTPTQIADFVSSGADPAKIARIKRVVEPETWEQVQRLTMEKVLMNITKRTKDPLEDMLSGDNLLKELDKFGQRSLQRMFGDDVARNLYQLGNAARAVEYKPGNAGQLIAATIAASPLQHIGRLMQLKALGKYLASPTGARHFTTGLRAKKTRAVTETAARIVTDLQLMAESDVPAAPVDPEQLKMQVPPGL